MFNILLNRFSKNKEIETSIEVELPKVEDNIWDRTEKQVIEVLATKQIRDSLSLACYSVEEIEDTKRAKAAAQLLGLDDEKLTQEEIYKLKKQFPKAVISSNRRYGNDCCTLSLEFDIYKLEKKLTKELIEKIYESKES